MSTLDTFRLWLEPDIDFPRFKRLKWEMIKAPIEDVLLRGVHPWMGPDKHYSLPEAFLQRLNNDAAKIPALEQFGYSSDMALLRSHTWQSRSRFERTLEVINNNIYFVDDLTYLELLDIAKQRLLGNWCHRTARALAEIAYPVFQELRAFLKSKDKSLKLSGYADLEQYDLGEILTLSDFEGRDSLIISQAIHSLNFRKATFLGQVTDDEGRLRLAPEINHVTLTNIAHGPDYVHLVWYAEHDGEMCRFRPDIGNSEPKRRCAQQFAEQWRTDEGKLCFRTNIDHLVQMIEEQTVIPSFPTLAYGSAPAGPTARASVGSAHIEAFSIGRYPNHKWKGEDLKAVLRHYCVSMTGSKAALVNKLAKLAAKQYEERLAELDGFFSGQRFMRVDTMLANSGKFPVLEDARYLRNLLMAMYAVKRLRGNAILAANHENNTYTEEELALALVRETVSLSGAFLRVA